MSNRCSHIEVDLVDIYTHICTLAEVLMGSHAFETPRVSCQTQLPPILCKTGSVPEEVCYTTSGAHDPANQLEHRASDCAKQEQNGCDISYLKW